jgi:uncharacterized protein (DUF58 family)
MNFKRKSLALTIPGMLLLSFSFFLFTIGSITKNSGLIIIGTLFVVMFVTSVIIAFWGLSIIRPVRRLPHTIQRFCPYLFSIGLENSNSLFAVYSLKVKDVIDGTIIDKPCYFFKIPPSGSQTTYYRHAFVSRGNIKFNGLMVSTSFPFALIRVTTFLPLEEEKSVFPEITFIPKKNININRLSTSLDVDYSVRPYRLGDHPRFIHWPSSMRKGHLISRTEKRTSVKPVWLKIENRLLPHPEGGYIRASDQFELTISFAAGLARSFLNLGWEVGIVVRGNYLPPVAGEENIHHILRFLANMGLYEGGFPQLSPNEVVINLSSFNIEESVN